MDATDKQKQILIKNGIDPTGMNSKDASVKIGEIFNGSEKPSVETVKVSDTSSKTDKNASFHVSYAKDICIAIINNADSKSVQDAMNEAVSAVLIARNGLE